MELNLFCANVRIYFYILESIEIGRNIGTAQNVLTDVMLVDVLLKGDIILVFNVNLIFYINR